MHSFIFRKPTRGHSPEHIQEDLTSRACAVSFACLQKVPLRYWGAIWTLAEVGLRYSSVFPFCVHIGKDHHQQNIHSFWHSSCYRTDKGLWNWQFSVSCVDSIKKAHLARYNWESGFDIAFLTRLAKPISAHHWLMPKHCWSRYSCPERTKEADSNLFGLYISDCPRHH